MKAITLDNATTIGVVFDDVLPPAAWVGRGVGLLERGFEMVGSTARVGEFVGFDKRVTGLGVGDGIPSDASPEGWADPFKAAGGTDGGT